MRAHVRRAPRAAAGLAALAAVLGAAAPAQAATSRVSPVTARTSAVATTDSLPTAQIGDGVVWSQAIRGGKVYAGGEFTTARPPGAAPGTKEVRRTNLLSYDIRTGRLTGWRPRPNNVVHVLALSPDHKRLYVGGAFTSIGGATRNRIAAFDTATGKLVARFHPSLNSQVRAIAATNTRVYVGGMFGVANGHPRTRLAAFRASDGALLPWRPSADDLVRSMALTPDESKLVIGGHFSKVGGRVARGMAAVSTRTGGVRAWAANNVIHNHGSSSAILSVRSDGRYMYATGYVYGPGGELEGTVAMRPGDGQIVWVEDCHGDSYDSYPATYGVVYVVSHAHYCGNVGGFPQTDPWSTNMRRATAFTRRVTGTVQHDHLGYHDFAGQPSPSMINWFPDLAPGSYTGATQAAWTVTGTKRYVVMGGEFPTVNGVGQQGLARFAVPPRVRPRRGPTDWGKSIAPVLLTPKPGVVLGRFRANSDPDSRWLKYRVIRDRDLVHPIRVVRRTSTFWHRPKMHFTDTGLKPGSRHRYVLRVTDSDGNLVRSSVSWVTVTGSAR